ncbi:MAG: type II toxin-antitoxin system HigB family toxin [Blastocatellia bacterium]|nr:type II toxin-antitoxin system HigB family toxin [Blastocatellia bacterium]
MKLSGVEALTNFVKKHRASAPAVEHWILFAKAAVWENTADVKRAFSSVSFVGRCVIFNAGGNKYRIITEIDFVGEEIKIREILTHVEYNKIDFNKKCKKARK